MSAKLSQEEGKANPKETFEEDSQDREEEKEYIEEWKKRKMMQKKIKSLSICIFL